MLSLYGILLLILGKQAMCIFKEKIEMCISIGLTDNPNIQYNMPQNYRTSSHYLMHMGTPFLHSYKSAYSFILKDHKALLDNSSSAYGTIYIRHTHISSLTFLIQM